MSLISELMRLLWRQMARSRSCDGHDLNAKARIDRLDLVAEQPSQRFGLARAGVAMSQHVGVSLGCHALADQVENAVRLGLSAPGAAQLDNELADVARVRSGRPDGLAKERRTSSGHRGGSARSARRATRYGLIKTPAEFRTEAQRQRRTRLHQQIPHRSKPRT